MKHRQKLSLVCTYIHAQILLLKVLLCQPMLLTILQLPLNIKFPAFSQPSSPLEIVIDNKKTYNSFVEIQLAKSQIIHIIITSTTNKKRPLSFHVKWRRRKSETEIVHIYFPPPSFISVTISQQRSAIKKSELIRTEDLESDNLMKLDSQKGMTGLFLIQNIVFTKSKTLVLLNPKYWFYQI